MPDLKAGGEARAMALLLLLPGDAAALRGSKHFCDAVGKS